MQTHQPDMLKLAVEAAGGPAKVAEHFNVTPAAISGNIRRRRWKAKKIKELCELGGNVITVDQVVDFIAKARHQDLQRDAEAVTDGS